MDERLRFVARLLDGERMTTLCTEFGISRKTGYKIYDRYKAHGAVGLTDRSRRPLRHANQLPTYPLTITDFATRYLLGCEALESTREASAFPVFERVFQEFGLPDAMRTDNGVPFSSPWALYGLTKLSVWCQSESCLRWAAGRHQAGRRPHLARQLHALRPGLRTGRLLGDDPTCLYLSHVKTETDGGCPAQIRLTMHCQST
jgi:hypothetical protein